MSDVEKNEKLIEYVRSHVVLYNTDLKEYSDKNLKNKIWNDIARKCNFTSGNEAKHIWKNLRDCYRISVKKQKSCSNGDSSKTSKIWKFHNNMGFLAPYMKDRPRHNKFFFVSEGNTEADETNNYSGEEVNNDSQEIIDVDEIDSKKMRFDDTRSDEHIHFLHQPTVHEEQRIEEEPPLFFNEMAKPFQDSLKLFFDSMCAATRDLPTSLQRVVKKKIFEAVSEAEEAAEESTETMDQQFQPQSYIEIQNVKREFEF